MIFLIFLTFFLISCEFMPEKSVNDEEGKAGDIIKLEIPEPSGLTVSPDGKYLWIVSDNTGYVYKTDTRGNILSLFDAGGDLEGISYDSSTSSLWICIEETGEITRHNLDGSQISRTSMQDIFEAAIGGFDYNPDKGMEGIAVDADYLYIIIEDGYFIKLNKSDLSVVVADSKEITFSDEDYSGAYIDSSGSLWVASHKAMSVYKWDMLDGDIAELKYSPDDFNIEQLEGFTIDPTSNLVYICSDRDGYLYVLGLK